MASTPPQIFAQTKNRRTREAMLLGSDLEGGWNSPYPVGDNGTSFGPYQMHEGGALTSTGLTPQQAENPRLATRAMLPAYQDAVNQVPDSKWNADPEAAAVQAAQIAENPGQGYVQSRGSGVVNADWRQVQKKMKGHGGTGGMPVNAQTTSIPGDLIKLFLGGLGGLTGSGNWKDTLERAGLIIFGGALVLLGIAILAINPAEKAVAGVTGAITGTKNLANATRPRPDNSADIARRQAIAQQSYQLGERKIALQEKREARLALHSQIQAPARGKHARPAVEAAKPVS